ncbi:hypothetical protein MY5147_009226 [Beauveria neobassiana]
MKPSKQGITLAEKLDLIPATFYVILGGIVAMVTGIWRSERDAPSYYQHVAFSVLRKCTERFSPSQMEWALPLTDEVYNIYARSAGAVPRTVELCDGAKGHWVGNPDAKNVLIWYHGGGFAMAANGAFFDFFERVLAAARNNGKDIAIFMLTYSLSSQAQYPTQLKQAADALRYILSQTKYKPDSIVLCGDSAGASLAMGVTSHLAHPHPSIEAISLSAPLAGVVLMALPPSMDEKIIEERDIYYGGDLLVPDVVLKWRDQYLGGAKRDFYTDPYDAHPSWFENLPVQKILVLAGGNEVLKPLMEEFVDKVKALPEYKAVLFYVAGLISRVLLD